MKKGEGLQPITPKTNTGAELPEIDAETKVGIHEGFTGLLKAMSGEITYGSVLPDQTEHSPLQSVMRKGLRLLIDAQITVVGAAIAAEKEIVGLLVDTNDV